MLKLSKDEFNIWQNVHKDKCRYTFYYNGKAIMTKWLSDRNAAIKTICELSLNLDPNNFYYKRNDPIIIYCEDNTYKIYDNTSEISQSDINDNPNSISHNTKKQTDDFLEDISFYIKHYDVDTRQSHSKTEWYSLIHHIISDLKFNVSRLIDESESFPADFKSLEEWKNELCNLLMLIQEYEFYDELTTYNNKCVNFYTKMGDKFIDNHNRLEKSIPYFPKSRDIDYDKYYKLSNDSWNNLCDWMKKYGRNLLD